MSAWLLPLVLALISAVASWLVARYGRKGSRENSYIDQLQEDMSALRERIDKQDEKIARQDREILALQSRDAQAMWHIERLEGQVVELGGAPYPRPLALQATKETPGD